MVGRVTTENRVPIVIPTPECMRLWKVCRSPTTSFLTATTLRYATRAGILVGEKVKELLVKS